LKDQLREEGDPPIAVRASVVQDAATDEDGVTRLAFFVGLVLLAGPVLFFAFAMILVMA
jgi:hypothetical protein